MVEGNGFKLGVINLLGRTFMGPQVDNPFLLIEAEIAKLKSEAACIPHRFPRRGDLGENRLWPRRRWPGTLVVGTHTHVQTADDQILPNGTAYLTDAGFTGPHDSVIGRDVASVLQKYRTLCQTNSTSRAATSG